jgi:hypothetical protein
MISHKEEKTHIGSNVNYNEHYSVKTDFLHSYSNYFFGQIWNREVLIGILLVIGSSTCLWSQDKSAILKVNVLLGEQTMALYSPEKAPAAIDSLENVLSDALSQKGFSVYTQDHLPDTANIDRNNLYLIDVFVYLYPTDLKSVTLTLRNKNYILYMANESKLLYITNTVYQKLALQAIENIPNDIPYKQFFKPTIEGLIPHHMISIQSGVTQLTLNGYKKKYELELTLPEETNLEFILRDGFRDYMSLCVDFDGARKEVKRSPIEVDFEIDPWGFTKITEIRFPEGFPKKREPDIFKIEHSIPLWYNASGKTVPGTMKLGIKD